MMAFSGLATLASSVLLALAPQTAGDLVLQAEQLHLGDGQVMANAIVTIADGKIVSVTAGAETVTVPGAHLTPGLVDAFSLMGVTHATVEQSSEVAHHRVADLLDLDSAAFPRALAQGVTSAYVSPDSWNVIGGLGAFVKTAGAPAASLFGKGTPSARVIDSAAAVKISLGIDPAQYNGSPRGPWTSSFSSRRPTTRMGSTWEVRRSFYEAKAYQKARATGKAEFNAQLEPLVAALEGRIPVRVQARVSNDLQTAMRFQDEFEFPRLILEEATEAWLIADYLGEHQISVVLGPAFDNSSRALLRGPAAIESMRGAMHAEPICCEHLNEDGLPHEHEAGFDSALGIWRPRGQALDLLLLTAPPEGLADGFYRGRRNSRLKSNPAQARLLSQAGVNVVQASVEAHDTPRTESSLIHQARTAARAGLDRAEALTMITGRAAEMCGQANRLGAIRPGLDADLVLWSGDPLSETSRILLVVLDGRIVVDNRN